MNEYLLIGIGVVIIVVLIAIILVASKFVKTRHRKSLFNEESEQQIKNEELYNNLVVELERTEKISKNDESISLYNSWRDEFQLLNDRKVSIDALFSELENFYNDKDHKNFTITYSELEGRKYSFNDDLKNLYKKVKQYTEYELENTRISLQLKTDLKDLDNLFTQRLADLGIFNISFNEEMDIANKLILKFEELQRQGDYPEGRKTLKDCNRSKNKIEHILNIILQFYDYLIDVDDEINLLRSLAVEIKNVGFSINIINYDQKVDDLEVKKEDILSTVVDIKFDKVLEESYIDELEERLNDLSAQIDELKDMVEEKFNFIKDIMLIIDENKALIQTADEIIRGAMEEKQQIMFLYEIDQAHQFKLIDEDIDTYNNFKSDYNKLLEIAYEAKEDYAKIKNRILQSKAYLIHLINKMKQSLISLKSIRDDEIKATENIELYNLTLVQVDLYLRKYNHRRKMSSKLSKKIENIHIRLDELKSELDREPLNISKVRKIDNILYKSFSELVHNDLEEDVRLKEGSKLLIEYCALYNESNELNLTIKRLYNNFNENNYERVISESIELLKVMNSNGEQKYRQIVHPVERYKFSDVFQKTTETYASE